VGHDEGSKQMLKLIRVNKVNSYRDSLLDDDVVEGSSQVVINPTAIKSYYARKEGKVGTRINFLLGYGFAISETVDEFEALLRSLEGTQIVGAFVPTEVVTGSRQ